MDFLFHLVYIFLIAGKVGPLFIYILLWHCCEMLFMSFVCFTIVFSSLKVIRSLCIHLLCEFQIDRGILKISQSFCFVSLPYGGFY